MKIWTIYMTIRCVSSERIETEKDTTSDGFIVWFEPWAIFSSRKLTDQWTADQLRIFRKCSSPSKMSKWHFQGGSGLSLYPPHLRPNWGRRFKPSLPSFFHLRFATFHFRINQSLCCGCSLDSTCACQCSSAYVEAFAPQLSAVARSPLIRFTWKCNGSRSPTTAHTDTSQYVSDRALDVKRGWSAWNRRCSLSFVFLGVSMSFLFSVNSSLSAPSCNVIHHMDTDDCHQPPIRRRHTFSSLFTPFSPFVTFWCNFSIRLFDSVFAAPAYECVQLGSPSETSSWKIWRKMKGSRESLFLHFYLSSHLYLSIWWSYPREGDFSPRVFVCFSPERRPLSSHPSFIYNEVSSLPLPTLAQSPCFQHVVVSPDICHLVHLAFSPQFLHPSIRSICRSACHTLCQINRPCSFLLAFPSVSLPFAVQVCPSHASFFSSTCQSVKRISLNEHVLLWTIDFRPCDSSGAPCSAMMISWRYLQKGVFCFSYWLSGGLEQREAIKLWGVFLRSRLRGDRAAPKLRNSVAVHVQNLS